MEAQKKYIGESTTIRRRENERKNASPLVDWIKVIANSENAKYMPSDSSFELSHFEDFMDKRQKLMSDALKAILL